MTEEDDARAELMAECYRRGQSAFPLVSWHRAQFVEVCRVRWRGYSVASLKERLAFGDGYAEEFLVAACLAGRAGAAESLDRHYLAKLLPRLRQVCGSPDVADEALQAVREKLLLPPEPRLAGYENRGRLTAWLTIVAMRTALDVLRRTQQGQLRLTPLEEGLVAHALSPESQYSTRQFDVALRQALTRAVKALPEKQRFALKMQVVAGWSIDQIGRSLSTHRATAARWLVSAREQVERDVRATLVDELGLHAAEVDGALGALQSRLDLRVSQFFQSTPGIRAEEDA